MAIGQLFWGPVGDSYGRKPIILLGVIVAAITAFMLTNINSIGSFTTLRFIQGFLELLLSFLLGLYCVIYFAKKNFLVLCQWLR